MAFSGIGTSKAVALMLVASQTAYLNAGFAVRTASSCCSKNDLVVKAVNNTLSVTNEGHLARTHECTHNLEDAPSNRGTSLRFGLIGGQTRLEGVVNEGRRKPAVLKSLFQPVSHE